MLSASSRRHALVERIAGVQETVRTFEGLDLDTLTRGVPEKLASRLSEPRFRTRLSMRHARRFVGKSLLTPVLDDREEFLMADGAPSIQALVALSGAHVLSQRVLRVMHRDDLAALTEDLGVSPRAAAVSGRDRKVGVSPLAPEDMPLSEAIISEGALCWACWLATRDESAARRFRALTPNAIMTMIPKAAPGDAKERERRRFVVDIELNAMVAEGGSDE